MHVLYMVPKVRIARASRWATSPATPPLVGRRVKNVLEGKLCNCCISGATTETEVFRESCFCSDRAVFDTIGAIIHTALLQLVTTVRSVLVEPEILQNGIGNKNFVQIKMYYVTSRRGGRCVLPRIAVIAN